MSSFTHLFILFAIVVKCFTFIHIINPMMQCYHFQCSLFFAPGLDFPSGCISLQPEELFWYFLQYVSTGYIYFQFSLAGNVFYFTTILLELFSLDTEFNEVFGFVSFFKGAVPLSSGLHYFADEKTSIIQITIPLYVMCHFTLTAFKISLVFCNC